MSQSGDYLQLSGDVIHSPRIPHVWRGVVDSIKAPPAPGTPSFTDSITWIDRKLALTNHAIEEHAIQQRWNNDVESPGGHGAMGVYLDGQGDAHDCWAGNCKGSSGDHKGRPWARQFANSVVRYDADTGLLHKLSGPRPGHSSARNLDRPNWIYHSGDGLLWANRLDGGRVEFYGRTFTPHRRTYEDEAHASVSRDGKRIIFRSSWGHQWPEERTEMYILDISALQSPKIFGE
tara:strand:+ start:43588 stop:44286 length:699 start_codon:yes stop_codon:yes gene_type:complete